jgi:hypothetical protein
VAGIVQERSKSQADIPTAQHCDAHFSCDPR